MVVRFHLFVGRGEFPLSAGSVARIRFLYDSGNSPL
jgi:hypothetical protein